MAQPVERSGRFSISRLLRRLVLAAGIGGTAGVLWLEELTLFAEEILALIFLPVAAGLLYLFNILAFNAHIPKRDD